MYKLHKDITDPITGVTREADVIIRKADNAGIPKVEGNTGYEEYLKWVAEGNTPDAAD
tara:strand:- start:40 stop:213 length:174 start_codon:yes stop_codon:yes gene_type:complete